MSEQGKQPSPAANFYSETISGMGGSRLSLSMRRFSNGETGAQAEHLWRLRVIDALGSRKPLIDVDATYEVLSSLRAFADGAIRTLQTDGGRLRMTEADRADGMVETLPDESLAEAMARARGVRS